MPIERREKLPFRNGRPSHKFARSFGYRHKTRIRFSKVSAQEGRRFPCTNASNLTAYFAEVEAVIMENNIDAKRMANLDESGFSPDKDIMRTSKRKHYGTISKPLESKLPEFAYKHRISVMPVIFADGSCASPVFILRVTDCRIV